MPVILPIERKSFKARFIIALVYAVLTLGAFTMIWPFLMMFTGSLTNRFDYHRYSPVLRSLFNGEDRFMRVMASVHPMFPREVYPAAPAHWGSWTVVARDTAGIDAFARPWLEGLRDPSTRARWQRMAADYAAFNATYSVSNSICLFDERDVGPFVQRAFGTLDRLNVAWKIRYSSFFGIRMRAQQRMPMHHPDWDWPQGDPKSDLYQAFKTAYRNLAFHPGAERAWKKESGSATWPVPPESAEWGRFVEFVSGYAPYTRTRPFLIRPLWETYLKKNGLGPAPAHFPAPDSPHWGAFVQTAWPKRLLTLSVTPGLTRAWHEYLHETCRTPENYAALTGDPAPAALEAIPLSARPATALERGFVSRVPLAALTPHSPEADWQAFLRARYSIAGLNEAYGWQLASFEQARFPFAEAFAVTYANCGLRMLASDMTANYRNVCDYLFLRGRAFTNTLILVILTICATLTVNPLAAYALSRFRLRRTESILLFLLATMAFPAAVTAIPGFILIRQLGLLNTFAALVLPTVANGLSIFILKGFFDGLPRELYEAAIIDGAGEWQIFRKITLPMTTPILAVNALNAFISAYSGWEWALLVCQKQSHWTLAVWMYQMSQQFSDRPWVVMAGFVMISVPTAAVFLACQRVIMRGIVLPSMK